MQEGRHRRRDRKMWADEAVTDFQRLLVSAKRNDRDAFEALYLDVSPLVFGYLRSMGVPEFDDLAGEVFLGMIRGLPGFEGDERQFRSWLLTITHRRVIDQRRRRRPEPVELAEDDQLDVTQLPATDAAALDRIGTWEILHSIDQLTEDQRSVVMLRVLADMTVPEIAVVVDKSESAVKGLLRRSVAQLERRLGSPAASDSGRADGPSGDRPEPADRMGRSDHPADCSTPPISKAVPPTMTTDDG